jgi:hypothetical protein
LKVKDNVSVSMFDRIRIAAGKPNSATLAESRSRLKILSRFDPVRFACCENSCVCFTGPYMDLDKCPECQATRLDQFGRPKRIFSYMPLIPRLRALMSNAEYADRLRYRARNARSFQEGKTTDVFDGLHYRSLLERRVVIGDEEQDHTFFSDARDIALGLATDGFAPFKKRKYTAWILLVFNYNLPPEERFNKDNIFCLGIVPGPKKPVDMDSFLFPAVEEFLLLEKGVSAYDSLTSALFVLRAYLIVVFGDIPAVSLLMRMKGHNGLCPCRMCEIVGVRNPESSNNTHYVPLSRPGHEYDPRSLPLRSHDRFMEQANEVQSETRVTRRKLLEKKYGIKGVPILSRLSSLAFPHSFPFDFMHLIWENLIPNLVLFWTGNFKGLDTDQSQPYVLGEPVWAKIGRFSASASETIPSAFGGAIPDPAKDRTYFTSSIWSVWTLFVAPTLLRGQFRSESYYKHFCSLVSILNLCLQYEISDDDLNKIESGIVKWVLDYERYVTLSCGLFYITKSICLAFIISTPLSDFQLVHSPYTHFCTSPIILNGLGRSGLRGHFRSSGNAGFFKTASAVDEILTQTWTNLSSTCHSCDK